MIIIPELKTLVITPPRTGSRALRAALATRYPCSKAIYSHMERDGAPEAFRQWNALALFRDPVARLVSIWSYMRYAVPHSTDPGRHLALRADARLDFIDWLNENRHSFVMPGTEDGTEPLPFYRTLRRDPIATRPQADWLRPDLGPIEILDLDDPVAIGRRLGVILPRINQAPAFPEVVEEAWSDPRVRMFLAIHHAEDLEIFRALSATTKSRARRSAIRGFGR